MSIVAEVERLVGKNKALAALFAPIVLALLGAAGNWIQAGGPFDWTEVKIAGAGAVAGVVSAVATYFTPVKEAVVKDMVPQDSHEKIVNDVRNRSWDNGHEVGHAEAASGITLTKPDQDQGQAPTIMVQESPPLQQGPGPDSVDLDKVEAELRRIETEGDKPVRKRS